MLAFCKQNAWPWEFRDINKWWATRPNAEKPKQKPINANNYQLNEPDQIDNERKVAMEHIYENSKAPNETSIIDDHSLSQREREILKHSAQQQEQKLNETIECSDERRKKELSANDVTDDTNQNLMNRNDIEILIAEIVEIDNEKSTNNSVNSIILTDQPLIEEIIQNESEYRKYIRTQPNGNTEPTAKNNHNSKNSKFNDKNSQSASNNNGNNNNGQNNTNNNGNNNDGDDDDKDEKKPNCDKDNTDEFSIDNLMKKVEKLKQHKKYKIMEQQKETLLENELIALVYYTDSNSCCHKMKQAHRRLILANSDKWKMLYYHATNAVVKLNRVFHYKNDNKLRCKMLFHGSTISTLDELSQEQLFLKTLFSFSTQFAVAKC